MPCPVVPVGEDTKEDGVRGLERHDNDPRNFTHLVLLDPHFTPLSSLPSTGTPTRYNTQRDTWWSEHHHGDESQGNNNNHA